MKLIMLGSPGAGKGTQAKELAKKLRVPHISTGDIFRAAIKKKTRLGIEARKYIDSGGLVPDKITVGMIRERLDLDDCSKGFILDGFPRTVPQAESLNEILKHKNTVLDAVVEVRVGIEALVNRLENRRSCPVCGKIYHIQNNPPVEDNLCNNCKVELVHRSDDRREVIENRIAVYYEKTNPLIEYYQKMGILTPVNGEQTIEGVMSEISKKLNIKTTV